MKKTLLIIITILSCWTAIAEETPDHTEKEKKFIKGFSGGMMVHTGYLWGGDGMLEYSPQGPTFGIGGVARAHLTEHLRTGFEGYFSNMGLDQNVASGSYNKLFWVGALFDCFWKSGKCYPYVGTSIGGGSETAFYMFEGNQNDWLPEANVVLHKQPFLAIDPFIGCDFAVTDGLRLTVKADWLMAINSDGLNRPLGPRVYFGFIFAH